MLLPAGKPGLRREVECAESPNEVARFQPGSSLTRGFIVPKARTRQADGDLLQPYSIAAGFLPRFAPLPRGDIARDSRGSPGYVALVSARHAAENLVSVGWRLSSVARRRAASMRHRHTSTYGHEPVPSRTNRASPRVFRRRHAERAASPGGAETFPPRPRRVGARDPVQGSGCKQLRAGAAGAARGSPGSTSSGRRAGSGCGSLYG